MRFSVPYSVFRPLCLRSLRLHPLIGVFIHTTLGRFGRYSIGLRRGPHSIRIVRFGQYLVLWLACPTAN